MPKYVSKEEFNERIKKRFPEESFTIIEYTRIGKPGKIQCNTCNKIIEINAIGNFLAKNKRYGCVNCHGYWRDREVKIEAITKRYIILESFVKNTHTHYKIKCKNCGHERSSSLSNLYTHLECGCMTGVYRNRTPEKFINEVNISTLDKYELISEYKNQTTKVKLRHSKCGLIISCWPHDAINGKISCPHCHRQESKGERRIRKVLQKRNISFEQEKPLENGTKQRFDFYFENEYYKIAIEYQGKQHYEEVDFFQSNLDTQQKNDDRKRKYCQKNNILLYEIPYYLNFQKVDKIINDIINKFNDYPNGVDSSESKSCLSVNV